LTTGALISLAPHRASKRWERFNIYVVSADGVILENLKKIYDWSQLLIGARVDQVVMVRMHKQLILDMITQVLKDGLEQVLYTRVRLPSGAENRRLTIHRNTDTTVTIISTRARDNVPQRDPPGNS